MGQNEHIEEQLREDESSAGSEDVFSQEVEDEDDLYVDEAQNLPRWSPMHRGVWYARRRTKVYDHYVLRRTRDADFRRQRLSRENT